MNTKHQEPKGPKVFFFATLQRLWTQDTKSLRNLKGQKFMNLRHHKFMKTKHHKYTNQRHQKFALWLAFFSCFMFFILCLLHSLPLSCFCSSAFAAVDPSRRACSANFRAWVRGLVTLAIVAYLHLKSLHLKLETIGKKQLPLKHIPKQKKW